MSDHTLTYLINILSGLPFGLPIFIIIIASWRVSRLRNLQPTDYQDKVDESVANTIKEQLSDRVLTPLFTNNNIVLPAGRRPNDVIDEFVPENNIELLSTIYNNLSELGVHSQYYDPLVHIVYSFWGVKEGKEGG